MSKSDLSRVQELREAYSTVYNFLKNKDCCYEIHEDNDARVAIDLVGSLCSDENMTDAEIAKQALNYHKTIDLDAIYKREYIHAIQANQAFATVQANTVLSVVEEYDCSKSMIAFKHTPGTDKADVLKAHQQVKAAATPHGELHIYIFFKRMLTVSPPATLVEGASVSATM